MSNRTINLGDALHRYLLDVSLREHPALHELRTEMESHPRKNMQIAPEQGQFMAMLIRLMGAHRTLEIGTFTGYSTLAVALALPDEGQIVACEINADYAEIARQYWQRAGVAKKIDVRIAPAVDTLNALVAEGQAGTFDFVFIDADKENYGVYYEHSLQLLHPGGLIVIDNVLWDGKVARPAERSDPDTHALHELNEKLHEDERIDLSMLPVADGLTLARKR